jgi:predicted metalloprotease with PDZ domain
LVVTGAWPDFDAERLLADVHHICEAAVDFWHAPLESPPFDRYVFMLNVVDDGYGGLEHAFSTALIAARRDLPSKHQTALSEGYTTLLGLISHEYFHAWNVKRLMPSAFKKIDYTRENHTELLWFFEGFTSYYDDLLLVRAKRLDGASYVKLLAKTINQVLTTPGRLVQSVAQASFDAWTKYYRPDENTPNSTISYYTKGALVALAFDLTLRLENSSLDKVMQNLWHTSQAGTHPIDAATILKALNQAAKRSMQIEFTQWVHGTLDLPLKPLLAKFGIDWLENESSMAQQLGLRASESALTGIKISHVFNQGVAQRTGLMVGDELIAVNNWRVRHLQELPRLITPSKPTTLTVVRDQRLLTLDLLDAHHCPPYCPTVTLTAAPDSTLTPATQAMRQAWWHHSSKT